MSGQTGLKSSAKSRSKYLFQTREQSGIKGFEKDYLKTNHGYMSVQTHQIHILIHLRCFKHNESNSLEDGFPAVIKLIQLKK